MVSYTIWECVMKRSLFNHSTFDFIYRNAGTVYSVFLFAFVGLSALAQQYNFDIPAATQVRDAAPFTAQYDTLGKLENVKKPAEIASSHVSSVPRTARFSINVTADAIAAQHASIVSGSSLFKITNPQRVSDPSVDAGYGVKRYGAKFLYGHSSLAFSPLKRLYEGDRFVVEMDGEVVTYQVARREVIAKSTLDASSSLRSAIYAASYRGKSYHLALMTCGDGSNDDSSYRLILFANRV